MTEFWNTPISDGGKLTPEMLRDAYKALLEQQDAYHREGPQPIIYPASLVKK